MYIVHRTSKNFNFYQISAEELVNLRKKCLFFYNTRRKYGEAFRSMLRMKAVIHVQFVHRDEMQTKVCNVVNPVLWFSRYLSTKVFIVILENFLHVKYRQYCASVYLGIPPAGNRKHSKMFQIPAPAPAFTIISACDLIVKYRCPTGEIPAYIGLIFLKLVSVK